MDSPTISDVLDARRIISPYISRTPLRRYPALSDLIGADVWIKHENYQVLGAFKVRGGVNLVGRGSADERRRGYVSASTGNHGQSVAFAARTFGASCTIVVPENPNPVKIKAMESLGAKVVRHGTVFEEALEYAVAMAESTSARFVHPANEPLLIAGVATYSLEIFEEVGDIDYLVVPLGAGSGAAGTCIVKDAASPRTKVIAVQSAHAPAGYESWKQGKIVSAGMKTIAEGIATSRGYDLPQQILRGRLHDFVLVDDAWILEAIYRYVECARTLVETAGAASLAAALNMKDRLRGKRVVLVASGGNISPSQLRVAMDTAPSEA